MISNKEKNSYLNLNNKFKRLMICLIKEKRKKK